MTVPIRRFEPGASGYYCTTFLAERGYRVSILSSSYFLLAGPTGKRPKKIRKRELMALVDRERLKLGLEPIRKDAQCR